VRESHRSACLSWGIAAGAAIVVTASVPASAAPERATSTAACLASSSPTTLALDVVNTAGLSSEMVDGAMAETVAIFATAGVRLSWTLTPTPRVTDDGQRVVVMLVRGPFPPSPAILATHRPDSALAWLDFDANGRPGNVIRLSFHAVATLARRATMMNLRVSTLPEQLQAPILSRAIGRVLAHEIGHWFTGRGHTREGLMTATFRERDLVDFWSPQLPRDWRVKAQSGCSSVLTLAASARGLP
jgi:hypothetical protein